MVSARDSSSMCSNYRPVTREDRHAGGQPQRRRRGLVLRALRAKQDYQPRAGLGADLQAAKLLRARLGKPREQRTGREALPRFRRLKGYRRIFSRFEKLDIMFLGFISFVLVADALRMC
jgi:hypothetical protein